MVKIEYKDFMRLSEQEKCIRYKDLNDSDKQKVRMTDPMICGNPIGHIILTEKQKKKGKAMTEETMKIVEIRCKHND